MFFFYLNRLGKNDARFLFSKLILHLQILPSVGNGRGKKKRTPYMVALDTTKRCMCTEEEECNQDLVSVSPSSFLFGLRYILFFFPDVEEEKGERCIIFFLGIF